MPSSPDNWNKLLLLCYFSALSSFVKSSVIAVVAIGSQGFRSPPPTLLAPLSGSPFPTCCRWPWPERRNTGWGNIITTERYRSNKDNLPSKFKREIPVWPLSSCRRRWWAGGWCWTLWRGWRKRSRTARPQLARLPHFHSVGCKMKLIRKNRNRRQTVI